MSKRKTYGKRWMSAAAHGLSLLFGSLFAVGMQAQTSGVAPLVSGDCSASSAGVMTCAKTNGTAFAASATTDTTNAANITSGTLPTARTAALIGDVTKASGSSTTTVTAVNGLTLPTTAGVAATNASGQIVAATPAQARSLICTGTASANYYCDGGTGAWAAIPWTVSANANLVQYNTSASTASTPAMLFTGSLYTGGTGTTTTPHWYINQGGTAPTTWATSGTLIGTNAPSGFSGNHVDVHTNGGSSLFSVNYRGDTTVNGYLFLGGAQVQGGGQGVALTAGRWISNSTVGGFTAPLYTPASSTAACAVGTVAWDASYFYVCKATNTWMRTALSSF